MILIDVTEIIFYLLRPVWLTFEMKSGICVDCGSGQRPVESGGNDTYPIHCNYKDNEKIF